MICGDLKNFKSNSDQVRKILGFRGNGGSKIPSKIFLNLGFEGKFFFTEKISRGKFFRNIKFRGKNLEGKIFSDEKILRGKFLC